MVEKDNDDYQSGKNNCSIREVKIYYFMVQLHLLIYNL